MAAEGFTRSLNYRFDHKEASTSFKTFSTSSFVLVLSFPHCTVILGFDGPLLPLRFALMVQYSSGTNLQFALPCHNILRRQTGPSADKPGPIFSNEAKAVPPAYLNPPGLLGIHWPCLIGPGSAKTFTGFSVFAEYNSQKY